MAFLVDLCKRSLENPSTPLSAPDDWLFDSLGSFKASSGVNVNRETALTYDAYWRCTALLSGDTAKLPLCVYRRDGDGKQHATKHPAYELLRYQFCPELDALQGKRVLTFHALTEGNGYGYINRDGAGRPIEIWPLSPMKTYPIRESGQLWYVTQYSDDGKAARRRKIPADDVLHIRGYSFDGLVGYSAISKMREAIGLAIAAENFGSLFFRNNARPNVVLRHPGRLKPEARQNLRESWERLHSGLENAHRTAILEEGMDLTPLMHNARDSQLLELKSFSRVQIANFFGIPSHKVGDSSRTSYNSLEQENQSYVEDGHGLGYWLCAWESECRRKLLSSRDKGTYTVEFNRRELLRGNVETRTKYYTTLVERGILSPNEVRAEEGYNPRDGGDVYLTPLNMTDSTGRTRPVGDPDQAPDTTADGTADAAPLMPTALLAVPDVPQQYGWDCGAAAVRAVARFLGLADPGADGAIAALGTSPDDGTRPAAIVAWLACQGLEVTARTGMAVEDLQAAFQAGKPVICPIQDYGTAADFAAELSGHYVVVVGVALGQVIVQDPSATRVAQDTGQVMTPGQVMIDASRFTRAWHDSDADGNPWPALGIVVGPGTAGDDADAADRMDRDHEVRWGRKPQRSVEDALAVLRAIPESDVAGEVPVGIPIAEGKKDVATTKQLAGSAKRWVRVSRLTATQPRVKRALVARFIRDPDRDRDAKVATTHNGDPIEGLAGDLPYVVKSKEGWYIIDGHHRLTAARLAGQEKVKVYYCEV